MATSTKKPAPKKQPLFQPWVPPFDVVAKDIYALRALAKGNASDVQQVHALKFIVEKLAGTYEEQFCPGEEGRRTTDYALGMRRVGTLIVSYLAADVSKFEQEPIQASMPSASVINK